MLVESSGVRDMHYCECPPLQQHVSREPRPGVFPTNPDGLQAQRAEERYGGGSSADDPGQLRRTWPAVRLRSRRCFP